MLLFKKWWQEKPQKTTIKLTLFRLQNSPHLLPNMRKLSATYNKDDTKKKKGYVREMIIFSFLCHVLSSW